MANHSDDLVSRISIYRDSWNDYQAIQDNLIDFSACACRFGVRHYDEKRRNGLSLFTNVIFPYELYAVVSYRTYLPKLVWSSVLLAGILSLAFIILGMPSNGAQRTSQCRGTETSSRSQPTRSQNDNRRLHFGFDCANRYQQGVRAGTDDHKSAARFQCI